MFIIINYIIVKINGSGFFFGIIACYWAAVLSTEIKDKLYIIVINNSLC